MGGVEGRTKQHTENNMKLWLRHTPPCIPTTWPNTRPDVIMPMMQKMSSTTRHPAMSDRKRPDFLSWALYASVRTLYVETSDCCRSRDFRDEWVLMIADSSLMMVKNPFLEKDLFIKESL